MHLSSKAACWALGVSAIALRALATEPGETEFQVEAYQNSNSVPAELSYRAVAPGAADEVVLIAALHGARPILRDLGLVEAAPGRPADVEITLSLEINERVQSGSRYFKRFRPVTHRVHTLDLALPDADGNTVRVREDVIVPVEERYRAATTRRPPVTTYDKRFVIAARALTHGSTPFTTPRELWRVIVTNSDDQADAAIYSRMMTAIALDQVRQRSDGRSSVRYSSRELARVGE